MAANWTSVLEGRLHTFPLNLTSNVFTRTRLVVMVGYFSQRPNTCLVIECRFPSFVDFFALLPQDIKAVAARLIFVTTFSPSPQLRYFVSYYFKFPSPFI